MAVHHPHAYSFYFPQRSSDIPNHYYYCLGNKLNLCSSPGYLHSYCSNQYKNGSNLCSIPNHYCCSRLGIGNLDRSHNSVLHLGNIHIRIYLLPFLHMNLLGSTVEIHLVYM